MGLVYKFKGTTLSSYALVITTPPIDNKTQTALQFAKALIAQGHAINGIFFYQDGVLNANQLIQVPSDEVNVQSLWQEFSVETGTNLHLCISAAERRGLTDTDENPIKNNIAKHFIVSGLGELAVLTSSADKVVQL